MEIESLNEQEQKQASDLECNIKDHLISSDPNKKSVYVLEQPERQYKPEVYKFVTRKIMDENDFKSVTISPLRGMVMFIPKKHHQVWCKMKARIAYLIKEEEKDLLYIVNSPKDHKDGIIGIGVGTNITGKIRFTSPESTEEILEDFAQKFCGTLEETEDNNNPIVNHDEEYFVSIPESQRQIIKEAFVQYFSQL